MCQSLLISNQAARNAAANGLTLTELLRCGAHRRLLLQERHFQHFTSSTSLRCCSTQCKQRCSSSALVRMKKTMSRLILSHNRVLWVVFALPQSIDCNGVHGRWFCIRFGEFYSLPYDSLLLLYEPRSTAFTELLQLPGALQF